MENKRNLDDKIELYRMYEEVKSILENGNIMGEGKSFLAKYDPVYGEKGEFDFTMAGPLTTRRELEKVVMEIEISLALD